MEFFRRSDTAAGRPAKQARPVKPPKPSLTGAQALLALQANMEDPWADQD
jgi:hypothetical protein